MGQAFKAIDSKLDFIADACPVHIFYYTIK